MMSQNIPPNQSDSDNLIPMTSTLCSKCVFADYDHNNIQTGCYASRIEKFEAANIPVSQLVDDNQTSYIIEGKTCVYYRNNSWAHQTYNNDSKEYVLAKIKEELKIPYHVILFLRSTDTIDDLNNRLFELTQQKIKPKIVTVIDRSHSQDTQGLPLIHTSKYSFDYWRVQTIQAIDQIDTDVIDLVYDSTKKIQYMFYIVFECQYQIPLTISEEIHTAVHDNMKAFTILLPNAHGVGAGALKLKFDTMMTHLI